MMSVAVSAVQLGLATMNAPRELADCQLSDRLAFKYDSNRSLLMKVNQKGNQVQRTVCDLNKKTQ